MPFFRGMRASLVFLTRIPVGGFPYTRADWQWSSAHFPFAGLIVGAVMALTWVLVAPAGPWVAACVVVAAGMLTTGAFHEDGLADTADALGGAYDRERLFVILKDSRIGSFGAAALGIVLLLRVALLARLSSVAVPAIVVSQCVARMPPIWLMTALPYVTLDEHAKSRTVARASAAQALVATTWALLAIAFGVRFGLSLGAVAAAVLAMLVATIVCGARFRVRAGGITGDFLGATEQVCECVFLLALAIGMQGRLG